METNESELEKKLADRMFAEARKEVSELIQKQGGTFARYRILGHACLRDDHAEEALEAYAKALKLGEDASLYHSIATAKQEVYKKTGWKKKWYTTPYQQRQKVIKAYESAIEQCPSIELFREIFEVFQDHPEELVSLGSKGIGFFCKDPLFYAKLSEAHRKLGNKNDSYAYMWKAIELRYNDATFIKDHFGDRLLEGINDDDDTLIVNRILRHNNEENRRDYGILRMISDFYRERNLGLDNEFFAYLSEARFWTSGETDLSAKYDMVAIEAYHLEFKNGRRNGRIVDVPVNQAAYERIVGKFAELKSMGFDVDNGHFKYHIKYPTRFSESVAAAQVMATRPRLELLH